MPESDDAPDETADTRASMLETYRLGPPDGLADRFARPDAVLLAIAVVFLLGAAVTVLGDVSRVVAVGASSALSLLVVGNALFRGTP